MRPPLRSLVVVCLLLAASLHAAPKDRLVLNALPSAPAASVPSIHGSGTHNWFYPPFCSPDGSLAQDFPVTLKLVGGGNSSGDEATVHFRAVGSLAKYATVPGDVTLTDDASTSGPLTISLNASGLAPGSYALNVKVSTRSNVEMKHDTIHIQVLVAEGCGSPSLCFYSDGDFEDLVDCASNPVPGSTGGTFKIVPKGVGASIVAATRPGSLYYNLIWRNTGADVGVVASFAQGGTTAVGSDAVHAFLFDSNSFVADLSAFQMVNSDGTPCGASGPCTVTVPAGKTLWLTWHVAWPGVGGSTANISAICPGDQSISASGQLAVDGQAGAILTSCGATATGYKTACPSGDVNGDGVTDVADSFYLVNYLFTGGAAPVCGSGDVNGSGGVDVSDFFYLLNYLFNGGPPPV